MNRQMLLLLAALVVTAAIVAGAALLMPGTAPSAPTYTNTTYGYAVTYPAGWQYAETAGSVAFSSPDGHEEMRITTDPLSGDYPVDSVLRSLNATYASDFARDIPGTEWVSTTETVLDGAPAYESVFTSPIQGEERYDIRRPVRGARRCRLLGDVHGVSPCIRSVYRSWRGDARIVPLPLIPAPAFSRSERSPSGEKP